MVMNKMDKLKPHIYIVLYLWIVSYALLWTLSSYYLDPTVPYDAVEAVSWGLSSEWGSPKNPWFVGFIMWPAIHLNFSYPLYWYVIHFIGVAIGMLGVWYLAYRLTGKYQLAWFALLLLNLSGIINFDIIPYNDNYILVALWPWMFYFFLRAVYDTKKWWLLFSLAAGLATMAKYSTLSIVGSIFLLSLFIPKVRENYRHPWFYISIGLWIALVIPNLFWLSENNFVAFKWVNSQIQHGFNLHIAVATLSVFYPLIIAAIIIYLRGGRLGWPTEQGNQLSIFVVLFPVSIIFIYFLFHDGGRMTEWLQPFIMIAVPIFVGSITSLPQKSWRCTFLGLGGAAALVLFGYSFVLGANIAGAGQKMIGIKALAEEAQERWHNKYNIPLRYVGGEDTLYQWLIIYASDRPDTIQPWTLENNAPPNIYNRDIRQQYIDLQGALLLGSQEKSCADEDFSNITRYFPQSKIIKEEIIYQSEPYAREFIMCLGFIAPKWDPSIYDNPPFSYDDKTDIGP